MAYLTKAELSTHSYIENINAISRNDDDVVTNAIDAAIALAKSYLSRFNLSKLFDPEAEGFVDDINLKNKVKDIASFNLITLANTNIDYDIFDNLNKNAIAWLRDVQKGQADPDGWPYKDDDADTDYPEGTAVSMISNTKRNNHY